jgi:hypothetical protein
MQYLSMQSMVTMQYVPELDSKLIGYGALWIVVVATSVIGVLTFL